MSNEFYVYEYYIKNTGEIFYIGKGKDERYKDMSRRNKFFKDMYNSHDCDVRIVCDNLTEKDAFNKEKELIKYYKGNTSYRITNQTDGGEGSSGYIHTEESKSKISKQAKLKWKEEDFRNNQIWHRQNGVYKSDEFRKKLSKITKGKTNGNYGNYWTDGQKEALRQKQVKSGRYDLDKNPNAKKVMCIETGEIYEYIALAMEYHNITSEGSMTASLKNKHRTAGGKHWVYITKENEPFFLNRDNRFNYLIECLLLNVSIKPLICLETKELFTSKTEMSSKLKLSVQQITWRLKKAVEFKFNDLTYTYLNTYYSRLH